jgi:hypothetical protein
MHPCAFRAHACADDGAQRHRGGLQYRYVDTQSHCGGCDFEPDETGADQHQPSSRRQRLLQSLCVIDGAQLVHEFGPRPRHRQCAWPTAGREQHRVCGNRFVPSDFDGASVRIESCHRRPGHDLDAVVGAPCLGQYLQRLECVGAGEELLRQRWPLVRQVRLIADQDDATVVSPATQGAGRHRGGLSRTDGDECVDGHPWASSPAAVVLDSCAVVLT